MWKSKQSEKEQPNKRRKLAILFATLMLFAMTVIWITPAFINPENYRQIISTKVMESSGHELVIKGAVNVELFPSPRIRIYEVEWGGQQGEGSTGASPLIRIDELTLILPWGSLLSDTGKIDEIVLNKPILQVEKPTGGEVNWGNFSVPHGKTPLPAKLTVNNGKYIYFDQRQDKAMRLERINLTAINRRKGMSLKGSFGLLDQPIIFQAALPNNAKENKNRQFDLKFWEANNDKTRFEATLSHNDADKWEGKMHFTLDEPDKWLARYESLDEQPNYDYEVNALGKRVKTVTEETYTTYPITMSSPLAYQDNALNLNKLEVKTPNSNGTGRAVIRFNDILTAVVALNFNELALSDSTLNRTFARFTRSRGQAGTVNFATAESRLPEDINLSFDLRAKKLLFGNEPFSSVKLSGILNEGIMVVSELSGKMSGDSSVFLSGRIMDTARGPRFQGKTIAKGDSFKQLLSLFDHAAAQLPETGFQDYAINANIFISAEQLRLSEADMTLGDLRLIGGMVTYFEETPRMEAEVSLDKTNLDYFRDNWRENVQKNGKRDFIFKINSSVDFDWLRQLHPIIDLKINLNRFQFLDQIGQKGSFRLYVRQNEFELRNIEMNYPQGILKGTVGVSVAQELPHLDIDIEVPVFDTAYFSPDGGNFSTPLVYKDRTNERWSKDVFDFGWMIGLTGKFNIRAPRIIHQGVNYDRFLMDSELKDEQLFLNRLTFQHFDGRFETKGTLVGGKVPGLSSSFSYYSADIYQILKSFTKLDHIGGRVSIGGTFSTSGINMEEWLRQADAKMTVAARGVRVEGFNMQGVVDAVYASRSVADVVSNVDRLVDQGSTSFSIDGNINLADGIARTPGLSLNAGKAEGTTAAELKLISWKMAAHSVFKMNMLQSETIPTLTVDINGAPDDFEMKIDTSSLEAFVAKRIVGR